MTQVMDDLTHCSATFLPGDPARTGKVAFWHADGGEPPAGLGERGRITVAVPRGTTVIREDVPAVLLSVTEATPVLGRARGLEDADPSARFWGAAALLGLQLVARGRMLPGVSEGGYDAWRAGPLDQSHMERVDELLAAIPPAAHAVPLPGDGPPELPEPRALLRGFLDAVADGMARTPAAAAASGTKPYARVTPQRAEKLRDWAADVATGRDAGVKVSLRLDFSEAEELTAVVQVHSLADPTLVVDAETLWAGDAPEQFGPRSRIDTLLALRRAARTWPPLGRLLDDPVPAGLVLGDDELGALIGVAAARLGAAGVGVHWPKDLARELTARAEVGGRKVERVASEAPSFFSPDQLLSFRWQLAIGGEPLTEEEMDRLAEAHRPVVRLRDQWVLVDPALVRKARERELKPMTAIDALATALTGTAEVGGVRVPVVASGRLEELRSRITGGEGVREPVVQPAALKGSLRDYQSRGLDWLDRMTSLGLGCALADDMGLGKTITLIALHLHRADGLTLVVCPASLLGNWEREIERFAPGTPVRRYHGSGRDLEGFGTDGFVLTTYGTMRLDAARLAAADWGMVVADEAQHVKNPHSGTAKALRTIPTRARVALTGTPVENNLSELWALLDWTTPGLLGTLKSFRARYAKAVEGERDKDAAEDLATLVRPFLLRRRKSDPGIAPELPPKTETDHPVALTREQASLYEAVVREAMAEIEQASGIARRGLVMKLLTALKQICNHPAQYLKEAGARIAGRSGKLELLDELLDTVLAEDGAVLVFTQYVEMARLIERHLAERGVPTQFLHGGTPVPKRQEMVDRFQAGREPVFLLSLKAAGTGLNLTRAGHVVHFDRWWNPAVEEQATDRAYRIGQTQPVQVHRLIAEGTVEDRIAAMLADKKELADVVLGGGEAALTELTNAELADLVTLRRAR